MKEKKVDIDSTKTNTNIDQVISKFKDNFTHYLNKNVLKQSNKSKETTMNILNIVGKIKHILNISIKNPSIFVDKEKENQTKLSSLKDELNKLINKDQVIMNQPTKIIIDNVELSPENTGKNDFSNNLKLDLIFFEMDDVYKTVNELKVLYSPLENQIKGLENNMFAENSMKRKDVYKRLFDICTDCMTDIRTVIKKEHKKKKERKKIKMRKEKEKENNITTNDNIMGIEVNDSTSLIDTNLVLDNVSQKLIYDIDNNNKDINLINTFPNKPTDLIKEHHDKTNILFKKKSINNIEKNIQKNKFESFRTTNRTNGSTKTEELKKSEIKISNQPIRNNCYAITHNSICLEEKGKKMTSPLSTSIMNFNIINPEKSKQDFQNIQTNELTIIQSVSHKQKKENKLKSAEEDSIRINNSNRSMSSNFSKKSSSKSKPKTVKTSLSKNGYRKSSTIYSNSKRKTIIKDNPFIKSLKIYKPGSSNINEYSQQKRLENQFSFRKNSKNEESHSEHLNNINKDEFTKNSGGYKKSIKTVLFNTDLKKKKIDHLVSIRHSNNIAENQLLSISKNTTIDTHKDPNLLYLSSKFSLGVTPQEQNSPIKEIDSKSNIILEKASNNSSLFDKEDPFIYQNDKLLQVRPDKNKKKSADIKEDILINKDLDKSHEKIVFNKLQDQPNEEENKLNISLSSTSTKKVDIKSRLVSLKSLRIRRNENGTNNSLVTLESRTNTLRSIIDDDIANVTARSRQYTDKIYIPISKIEKVKKPSEKLIECERSRALQNHYLLSENSERNNELTVRNEQLKMLSDIDSKYKYNRINTVNNEHLNIGFLEARNQVIEKSPIQVSRRVKSLDNMNEVKSFNCRVEIIITVIVHVLFSKLIIY